MTFNEARSTWEFQSNNIEVVARKTKVGQFAFLIPKWSLYCTLLTALPIILTQIIKRLI